MRFHNYLEEILGSRVKVKLVRTLLKYPNKMYSGRELGRQIKGISHMAVFKSLKDLVDYGLVKVEYHGGMQLIKLNKKSYLYRPLRSLFYYENRTKEKLIKQIRKIFLKKVESIILFGSIAKKEERVGSDIDLLIICKNKERVKDIIAMNQKKFSERFGNMISALILTRKGYKEKKNSKLIKEIKKEGIVVI